METLTSFQELLDVMEEDCEECKTFEWTNGIKATISTDTNEIIVRCKWWHEMRYKIDFKLTDEDKTKLEIEIGEFLASPRPITREEFDYHRDKSERLLAKIQAYGHSAPEGVEIDLKGYCRYCFNQVPMRVSRKNLWTFCSPCASVVADGVD